MTMPADDGRVYPHPNVPTGPKGDRVASLKTLADAVGRDVVGHMHDLNQRPAVAHERTHATVQQLTIVQQIALELKSCTYDEAQTVGAGLAQAIEANRDKDTGFDFSNAPIKLGPILAHVVQVWASVVVEAMTKTDSPAS